METVAEKTGAGAFKVSRDEAGKIAVSLGGMGGATYPDAQAAYDAMRGIHERCGDHSAWNAAYHLEDLIA
jgi:hypothetical protein